MFSVSSPLFSGCAAALVTPFLPDGTLDEAALCNLIHMQLDAGADALVLLGTTGEASTLSMEERARVIRLGIDTVAGRIPVIIGTGSNNTQLAMAFARQAMSLKADAQLSVTPYYNKATQNGAILHYLSILESAPLPMILYHVPGRTGMHLSTETVLKLSRHPLIAGIKEASGDLSYAADLIEKTEGRFPLYCGNDDVIVPYMSLGAVGAISVASNLLPEKLKVLTHACLSGDFECARALQLSLLPLMRALFTQVNPIPVKAALSMMQLAGETLRLPLTPMEEPYRTRLLCLLKKENLI